MIRRVAAAPPTVGMIMSITTTSGMVSAAIAIAKAPSFASATTTARPSASSACLSPIRHTSWSSTIMTRSRSSVAGFSCPDASPFASSSLLTDASPSEVSGGSSAHPVRLHWDVELDRRPQAGRGDHLHPSPKQLDPAFHALKHPDLPGSPQSVLVVLEALAGIANRRQQLPVFHIGENPGTVGLGVVRHVPQCLIDRRAQLVGCSDGDVDPRHPAEGHVDLHDLGLGGVEPILQRHQTRGCPEFRGTSVAAPMIIRPLPPPPDPRTDR